MSQSTLSQEELSERTVDYLDGRLDDLERLRFEATLAQNPSWAAEVEALGRTWREARRALERAHEPAPSRVRTHVLAEAAKRAAVLRQRRQEKPLPAAPAGAWVRLRRWLAARPWLAPTALAAAAVVLFVVAQRRERHSVYQVVKEHPFPQETSGPGASPSAEEKAAPTSSAPPPEEAAGKFERKLGEGGRRPSAGIATEASKQRRRVGAPAPRGEAGERATPLSDSGEAVAAPKGAQPSRVEARSRKPRADATSEGYARPPAGWSGGAASEEVSPPLLEDAVGAVAAPPPPAPTSAPAPPRAAPAGARSSRASAGAPASPAPREAHEADRAEAPPAAAEADDEASPFAGPVGLQALDRDTLLARVRQAEAAGQWAKAVAIYQELLRRHPNDEDAAAWRKALARARAAASAR